METFKYIMQEAKDGKDNRTQIPLRTVSLAGCSDTDNDKRGGKGRRKRNVQEQQQTNEWDQIKAPFAACSVIIVFIPIVIMQNFHFVVIYLRKLTCSDSAIQTLHMPSLQSSSLWTVYRFLLIYIIST